jgi:hypothetical protein
LTDIGSQKNPGAGGLSTLRVVLRLKGPWNGYDALLSFKDLNYRERVGWKDVVVTTNGSIYFPEGNRYAVDPTRGLTDYSSDPVADVRHIQEISLRIAPSPGYATLTRALDQAISSLFAPKQRQQGPDRLSEVLQSRNLPLQLVFIALGSAFSLGALHALTPGHGKTIVAAYLVGNRGTARHALFLGSIVFCPFCRGDD